MSHVRRFDHVGLTVADLDVVTAFFVALGPGGRGQDVRRGRVLGHGLRHSRLPHRDRHAEAARRWHPPGAVELRATRLRVGLTGRHGQRAGLRNVAFEVNDLQAAVDWAATEGYGLVGGIGEYEGAWRMTYVRGRKGSLSRWPSASAEPRADRELVFFTATRRSGRAPRCHADKRM